MRKFRLRIIAFFVVFLTLAMPAWGQTERPLQIAQTQARNNLTTQATPLPDPEAEIRTRINNWTVTILGGYMSGVHIRMATDLDTALDDGDNFRILPIVSRGAKQNVLDLLYLKGADIAFTHADVFEEMKKDPAFRNIERRVHYISQAHVSGMHLLVRPEIKTLKDLEGKKVGFHMPGTGVAVTSPIVFGRLGIKVEPVFVNNVVALEKMKSGELAGLVHLLTKGSDFIRKIPADTGFHLLSIEYDNKFSDYYTPYTIEISDYPNIIKPGEKVETVGVPAVLAVYNWPRNTDRYRRVERFIQYYFTRFEKLNKPPFQPEWKDVSLGANVPGWTRYAPAEEMLAKLMKNELSANSIKTSEADTKPNTVDMELFKEFLEWKKQHKN